jgi:hypothetical protein
LLAAYPAIFAAIYQGLGVFKLATAGIKNATTALVKYGAQSQQFKEASKGLTDTQKNFVLVLGTVQKQIVKLQAVAGEATFPGFTAAIQQLSKNYLPIVRTAIKETGGVLSDLAKQGAAVASTPVFRRDIATILHRNAAILADLGDAGIHVGVSLKNVLLAAGPMVKALAQLADRGARWLDVVTSSKAGQDALGRFFKRSLDTAKQLGRTFYDFGITVFNVGKIANKSLGIDFLGNLEKGAQKFRDFTESASGVQKIGKYFSDQRATITEFGLLIEDLTKDVFKLGGNQNLPILIHLIRVQLLPAINDLIAGVTGRLGPALVDFATAWVKMMSALSFSPLITVIDGFAQITIAVTDLVAKVPGLSVVAATILALIAAGRGLVVFSKLTGLLALFKAFQAFQAGAGIRGATAALFGFQSAAATAGTTAAGAAGGVTALSSAIAGPLALALALGVVAIGLWVDKKQKARQATQEFTDALIADSGAIGENTRQLVAQKLEQDKALRTAQQLGVQLPLVTSAALGNVDAQRELNAELSKFVPGGIEAANSSIEYTNSLSDLSPKQFDNAQRAIFLKEKVAGVQGQMTTAQKAAQDYTGGLGGVSGASQDLTVDQNALADAMDRVYKKTLGLEEAQDNLRSALNRAKEAIDKNKGSTKGNTDAAIAARDAIRNVVRVTNDEIKAYAETHKKKSDLLVKTNQLRDSVYKQLRAMGLGKAEARRYADSIGGLTGRTKGQSEALRIMKKRIEDIHGKKVSVTVAQQLANKIVLAAKRGEALTITGKPIPLATGGLARFKRRRGLVRGPGGPVGDKIPALLSDYEGVINARSMRKIGPTGLRLLNSLGDVAGDVKNIVVTTGTRVIKLWTGGLVGQARAFAAAQDPKPYALGGVGPSAYDCSGLVGNVWAILKGLALYHRYMTTASNFGALGFRSGTGAFTIGLNPNVHMAGNVGGLPFEAASTRTGIRTGGAATPVTAFPRTMFLASLGGKLGGLGTVTLDRNDLRAIMAAIQLKFDAAIGGNRRGSMTTLTKLDQGGTIPPGPSLVYNGTGKPERLTPDGGELRLVVDMTGGDADLKRLFLKWLRTDRAFRNQAKLVLGS